MSYFLAFDDIAFPLPPLLRPSSGSTMALGSTLMWTALSLRGRATSQAPETMRRAS